MGGIVVRQETVSRVVFNYTIPTLFVDLTADDTTPDPGQSIDLIAAVSGTAITRHPTQTTNYSFWWNCNNPSTSVADLDKPVTDGGCGDIPNGVADTCVTNEFGVKCDGMSGSSGSNLTLPPHAYTVNATPKVIVERGISAPDEDRQSITVNLQVSCSGPAVQTVDFPVTWIADASGGTGSYLYSWSGIPAFTCSGQPSAACKSVTTTYTSIGSKSASVSVTSGAQSKNNVPCDNTVLITGRIISFDANPALIRTGESSTLSWVTKEFDGGSCVINPGSLSADPPLGGSISVSPPATQIYTLTCVDVNGGTDTKNATVTVVGSKKPVFQEIKPK